MREEHLNSCCLCDLESVAEHSGGVSPLRMAQEKREEAMVPFTQGHSSTRVTIGVGYRTRGDLSGPSADDYRRHIAEKEASIEEAWWKNNELVDTRSLDDGTRTSPEKQFRFSKAHGNHAVREQ